MLLTTCDEGYLLEARALIRSCARHVPEQTFYLFLVNSNKVTDREIQRWHPQIIIERVNWPYDPEHWRGIMCCARSIPLVTILERYQEPAVYLDSDMLVRGSLSEVFGILEVADLTVKHRPGLRHIGAAGTEFASEFNSGFIGVNASNAGLSFARHYDQLLRDFMASSRPIAVYRPEYGIQTIIDQELLYVAYRDLSSTVKFIPLPYKFNDARFDAASAVWHGKGTARKHPLYRVERTRYQHAAAYYPGLIVSQLLLWARMIRRTLRSRRSGVT